MENNENKMGTMPVTKLLLNMALPIMLSMLVQALYNIVDSIFVAKIDEYALTAISLAFPIQSLMIAVGIGTAVGVNALLAMRLGQKNQESVNRVAVNGLFLAVMSYIAFFILGFLFINPYLKAQTPITEIISYGRDYLEIILYASLFMFMGMMSDRLLQATGRTFYTMITQLVGAITNIIFDPLFIFGIGIFPKMGIKGAALATVIGQCFAAIVSLIFNFTKNPDIHWKFKGFKPDGKIIKEIYKIAVPSILMQSINSVTTFGMNLILKGFTSTAIAVFGVYFKLNSFIFMPVFGLNTGMVPIISYNFGARNKKRILKTIRTSTLIAFILMSIGIVIFEMIPDKLLMLFNASEDMLKIGCIALRIIAPSFIGAALAISLSSFFQALGKAIYSMIISFVRQLVVLLPVAYLFSLTGNVNNVWLCFLVAEIFAITLSLFFYSHIKNTLLKSLD